MKQIQTKIGDHIINIISDSERLHKILNNFLPSASNVNDFPDLVITIKDNYGVPFQDYEVKITKKSSRVIFSRADYLIDVDSEYKSATVYVYDDLALKHALTNLYSSFIVYHKWGLLIHSSCAIDNGKAHLFAGHSGAGKSTAAKLSYPRSLLSDEATIVKITPNEVSVYNSPFRSELSAEPYEGKVELTSIQILVQALQNKRIRLEKADALLHLMDKVFFWPQNQEETRTIMKLLTLIVKQVPVYELHFQKNNTFWELIS